MLRGFALIVVLAVPAAAAAQGEGHRGRPAGPRETAAAPLPSTLGVPLPIFGAPFPRLEMPFPRLDVPFPRIGLPLAPIGLRPPAQADRHFRNRPFEREEREEKEVIYYVPEYYVPQPAIQIVVPPPPTEPPALEVPLDADKVAVAAPPAPPSPPPVPVTHKMFYIIPGCYLGDVPPKDASLPPTCDLGKTRTFQP